MNNTINSDFSEIYPIIKEKLENGDEVKFTPNGVSMLPTICGSKDKVILIKPHFPLKKNDICFYIRENGMFVLHRIIKVRENEYTMCGDNQFNLEKGIREDQIFAVVKAIVRDGKELAADHLTSKIFLIFLPARRFFKHGISFSKRIVKRIFGK